VRGIVLNARDVSERKAFEERLAHQAFHDSVTGLPNRALFVNRVEHAIARRVRGGDAFAVLFLDLDDFKTVNDSLGHAAGDELLGHVAKRIAASLRPGDTPARFGGDEFAILLDGLDDGGAAIAIAERVLAAVREPARLHDTEIVVRASVGISMPERADVTADEMIRNADTAMYLAKREGKGRLRVFERRMHLEAKSRLELRADLEKAIEAAEFELHYQPVVDLADGRFRGVEALVRWRHPVRGLVPPAEFVPLAEEQGLIVALGRWVVEEACLAAAEIDRRLPGLSGMTVSVNLSARQLHHAGVVGDVRHALELSGIESDRLVLEITESAMMVDQALAVELIEGLRALGTRIAMDDFGTGYSSLGYLSRLPVDILKMDRSFVSGVASEGGDRDLAAAVVALGLKLGLAVVGEGIETADQLDALRQLGCNFGQGYLFARPLPFDDLMERLAAGAAIDPGIARAA
jgi:diguanylate cyclase (GGDEF)-like protein